MRMLVCVKQVPDTEAITIDPVTHTLNRVGVPSILNACDRYALEAAVQLREQTGGTVTAMSLGPPQAETALRECLAAGADSGWLVSGHIFGGSDTLATSYALSCAVRTMERRDGVFDLILCGKVSADGETAQVGPELAEWLGLPQLTSISELTAEGGVLIAKRETADNVECWALSLPTLVTVAKTPNPPLCIPLARRLAARHALIGTLTAAEIGVEPKQVGILGSPTRVTHTFIPVLKRSGVAVRGDTPAEKAAALDRLLHDAGHLKGVDEHAARKK